MPVPFNVYEFFRFMIPGAYFVALLYVLVALLLQIPISFDVLSYQTVVYFFATLIVSMSSIAVMLFNTAGGGSQRQTFFGINFLADIC